MLRSGVLVSVFMIFGKTLSFFWKTLLFRTDPALLGLSEIILASATVFSSFSLLGMNTALVRFESKYRKKKNESVAELIPFSITIALVIFVILTILTVIHLNPFQFFFESKQNLELTVILPLSIFITFQEIFLSVLLGRKRIQTYSIFKYILQPFLRLLFIIIFLITFSSKTTAIPVHIILSSGITTLLLFSLIKTGVKFKLSWITHPTAIQKEFLKYVVPMSGSFITFVLFSSADIFFLQKFTTLAIVGIYTVLNTLSEVLDGALTPFLNLFHTYLGDYTNKDNQTKTQLILRQSFFFSFISLIYIIAVFILRHLILGFFNIDSSPILNVLLLLLLAEALNSSIVLPLRHFFDFENHVQMTFIFMLSALILKVFLLSVFVPHYALLGVAISQLTCILFQCFICITAFVFLMKSKATETLK